MISYLSFQIRPSEKSYKRIFQTAFLSQDNTASRFNRLAVDFQAGQFQIVGFAVVSVGDFGRNVAERGREGIVHDVVAAFDAVVVDGGFAAVERILRRTGFHQPADIIDALAVGDFQAGREFAVGGGQLPRQGEQVEDLSGGVFGLQFAALP